MFEIRSQQAKSDVNAGTKISQSSSHEQTCFLLKNITIEYRKQLESSCIIVPHQTLPKSEHQNRQEKKKQK